MNTNESQDLLNQIRQIGILDLYSSDLSEKDRKNYTRLAKQKLKEAKRQLRQEQKIIKARWDGRNRYEALQEQLHLAEYQPIEDLIATLEITLSELEIHGSGELPTIGEIVYGDFDSGEWFIGSQKDSIKWNAKRLRTAIDKAKENIATLEHQLKSNQDYFKSLIFFLLGGVIFLLFVFLSNSFEDTEPLLWGTGIAGFTFLLSIAFFSETRSKKKAQRQLLVSIRKEVQDAIVILRDLKQEYESLS